LKLLADQGKIKKNEPMSGPVKGIEVRGYGKGGASKKEEKAEGQLDDRE